MAIAVPSPTKWERAMPGRTMLIFGGRVYDHDGDTNQPPVRDILIEDGRIIGLSDPGEDAERKAVLRDAGVAIDARGLLAMPGFVNAHYHSYDVLAKGLLEDMPFDVWALHSQPAYFGPRSQAELRLRTLVGAIDSLRHGITTVQDMCSLVPMDEATLDTILAAYREIGLRTVFSIAVRDVAALDIAPFVAKDLPPSVREMVQGVPGDPRAQIDFVERQIRRLSPLPARLTWALSPSGPQRSSHALLEGLADLAARHALPVLTHVYETKAQAAKAREMCAPQGGSLVRYMDEVGLLGPRTSIVHGVWLQQNEIEMLASAGAGLVHNPISNMKLKSGIAPMRRAIDAGVNIALGCDNCSCGDCQSIFQGMKMLCLLAAVTDPQPTGVLAAHAIRAATLGGARAVGQAGTIGALRPGMAADVVLLDTADIAYVPFNSAARQVVYAEAGRGVHTVIVDGEVLLTEGRLTRIDESALRAEVEAAMTAFRRDFADVAARGAAAAPYLLDANARVARHDVGLDRFGPG
jgi:5-methylthioadenosine/S-adenosylhomocysteine deaminase